MKKIGDKIDEGTITKIIWGAWSLYEIDNGSLVDHLEQFKTSVRYECSTSKNEATKQAEAKNPPTNIEGISIGDLVWFFDNTNVPKMGFLIGVVLTEQKTEYFIVPDFSVHVKSTTRVFSNKQTAESALTFFNNQLTALQNDFSFLTHNK